MSFNASEIEERLRNAGLIMPHEKMLVSMSNLSDFLKSVVVRHQSAVALIPCRLNVAFFHAEPTARMLHDVIFIRGSIRMEAENTRSRKSPLPVCVVRLGPTRNEPAKAHFFSTSEAPDVMVKNWGGAASFAFLIMRETPPTIESDREAISPSASETPNSYSACMTGSGDQVIETHPKLYSKLNELFQFDSDPCPVFPKEDAMVTSWGKRAYVNAPFSYAAGFAARAATLAEEEGTITVMLAPARTGTFWVRHLSQSGMLRAVVSLYGHVPFKGHKNGMMHALMLLIIAPPTMGDTQTLFLTWDPNITDARRKTKMRDTFPQALSSLLQL